MPTRRNYDAAAIAQEAASIPKKSTGGWVMRYAEIIDRYGLGGSSFRGGKATHLHAAAIREIKELMVVKGASIYDASRFASVAYATKKEIDTAFNRLSDRVDGRLSTNFVTVFGEVVAKWRQFEFSVADLDDVVSRILRKEASKHNKNQSTASKARQMADGLRSLSEVIPRNVSGFRVEREARLTAMALQVLADAIERSLSR